MPWNSISKKKFASEVAIMSGESDSYEDMSKLNALYEELMFMMNPLDFSQTLKNNRIIIQLKRDAV